MLPNHFEIDVYGEYFAQVGDKKELRGYEATFRLPDAKRPLSVVVGKLLIPFLQKKDSQCVGVYTHHVGEIRCLGRKLDPNEIPTRFQSKEQLKEYILYHQLPINADHYGDLGLLRDHVRLAKEEPQSFELAKAKYETKRTEDKALYDLNSEVLTTMKTHKPVPIAQGGTKAPEIKSTTGPKKTRKPAKLKMRAQEQDTLSPEAEELLS